MEVDQEFYKNLLDNLHSGICFIDKDSKITYWNKGAEELTGFRSSEVIGRFCWDNILMHVNEDGSRLCKTELCPIVGSIFQACMYEGNVYAHHKNGHRMPISLRVNPLRDSHGQIIGAVELFNDNSWNLSIIQRFEEIQKLCLLDPLTELGNRRYAEISLGSRLNEMKRYAWPFGVLFIDIDRFKDINDMYGHDIGDKVLKMVSGTLLNSIRSFDTVARWGGEEFIAIIVNVNKNQLFSIANKLRVLVEQSSLSVGKETIQVTISIGATLSRLDDTVDTLLKRADQLMYHSKASGRNCISTELEV
ncbi:MAG: GGDEF domain-containing protein [Candidatus Tectomicrobia bacterium]|uniref:GGDEF domain-containing protein n=1 Tax=Tectimicrobiota bacterium TaxID=2528274 RepID=A0A932CLV4_UNCTE|nr:GGDEF domain-containing protein [Candidatus Tectomicrobia bacterium]